VRRSWPIALLALLASFVLVGTVLASHLPTNHNVTTAFVRGTLADKVQYNLGDIKVQTKGPVDIVVAEVSFPALASAGWHSHPGPIFVVIRTGTLSIWDETCGAPRHYSTGDSFFEAGPKSNMLVKNESPTDAATVVATFIVPVGTTALRIGEPHLCGIEE
jgi:quercetin dioxygenase-like cupin family protein